MAASTYSAGTVASNTGTIAVDSDAGAKLALRLLVGILVLFHGVSKLIAGPAFVVNLVTSQGMPSFVAYGVYVGEVVAPILMILGIFTRPAALVIVVNMIVALLLVHLKQFFSLGQAGGYALELQAFYLFGALIVAVQGAGRYSVAGANGRFN